MAGIQELQERSKVAQCGHNSWLRMGQSSNHSFLHGFVCFCLFVWGVLIVELKCQLEDRMSGS